jgi:hypothetical protein
VIGVEDVLLAAGAREREEALDAGVGVHVDDVELALDRARPRVRAQLGRGEEEAEAREHAGDLRRWSSRRMRIQQRKSVGSPR